MKTISAIVAFVFLCFGLPHVAWGQRAEFIVEARIAGIEKGDTLRFSKVILPQWILEPDFDIVVGRDGYGRYRGMLGHTQLYLMTYLPKSGKAPVCDRRGKDILLGSGVTKISGTRDYIYYSTVVSKIYDRRLQRVLAVQDSLGSIRGDLMRDIKVAHTDGDSVKEKRLKDEFNAFPNSRKADFTRIKELVRQYDSLAGGEYTAVNLAQETYKPVKELKAGFEKLTSEAKVGYYGRYVADMISRMEALEIGKPAPEIVLTTVGGRKIKISDFRGRYLLIYNFGMCPGSFQVDPHVAKLYAEQKDRLEVIGITDSFSALESARQRVPVGEMLFGMNVREALTGMLTHPWSNEVDSSANGNAVFSEVYYASGLPYFTFISPEGKIIAREIGTEAYDRAVQILSGLE